MIRIGEAVQETVRHCLDLLCGEGIDCASDAGLIQRRQYLALRVDALAHGQSQPAGNERRRQIDIDVVLLETVFVPDLDDVAEPFGGQKGSHYSPYAKGNFAFDRVVCGWRRGLTV